LHGRPRENESVLRRDGHYSLVDLRLGVLNLLGLVKNDIEPAALVTSLEDLDVTPQELIGGYHYAI